MQHWIRLAWIGLTNAFLFLTSTYSLFPLFTHGRRWYAALSLSIIYCWDLVFGAILGFVLDAVEAKPAKLVNVGVWVWIAVKSTAMYFSLWGNFAADKWLVAYVAPIAWMVAVLDFFLYRKRSELQRTTT